jgi:group I intron endonuclease
MIIYKVTNKLNNKIYIGKTKQSLLKRKAAHYKSAESNSPSNFHNALRFYSKDDFIWEIEQVCSNEIELNQYESHFIEKYDTYTIGYNMTFGGDGGLTYRKGDELYERVKPKLGKWKNGNPGATTEAIRKRVETFKNVKWISGELHKNFGHRHNAGILVGKKNPMARQIIVDGVEYETIINASSVLLIPESTIRYRCNSENYKNYKYKN